MTKKMTWEQHQQVTVLKSLYEEHDHLEMVLLLARQRGLSMTDLNPVWTFHDALEREIIRQESALPLHLVKLLKEGEL